ncbi:2-C-methyl-D-erythritol 4-phosphate cytidylyltransferase [Listeria ivanovii]|uniref:2-C-methyl-D-erythritol 4-phosphate cytidylyltransferase n=1 Tax=Listeria ivanovii (strain ATCC BAA-678 / PAM 55) TaxID=881621 RepID=G2ZA12_LISIP|nr:2-C-methyl-D-erythritol 4-phosphate cytidylyltransferase [Listeria ivanovii]AHI54819.1 2-C-methyl-D-erythritol 4-phosphate cytidylyltransferase [Listeria ivanovii WSLC3009]AIS64282.1 2-C-methyl-D-erythritol 4-phosphate cytidylyltransferase [Listeria ivanovii subsp. ivanovii]MBC1760339.1 2-C-methyl-D-erythritol 4-phosphate cytidylyltransferase [Listeria ivanovii]MBK3915392.1 2-C-methyl-D-erythritol 4-phosphate cytidylyltransferase [Listeria ivanovii subsp. ivanovii]MBK3922520.1 2-C-methyl-D-
MNYELVFLAAGQGKRMNAKQNKMWLDLVGEPIFIHALRPFLADNRCSKVIVVCQEAERNHVKNWMQQLDVAEKRTEIVKGGSERQFSVAAGLEHCGTEQVVLVHDGARPFVTLDIIDRLLDGVKANKAAICAVKVKDTVKRVTDSIVQETVDRENLWQVQTPQAFELHILQKAHQLAKEEQFLGTDEASLVERIPIPVSVVQGSYYNIKLTTPEDMPLAKAILGEITNMKKQI